LYAAFPRSEYRMGESDFHRRIDFPQDGPFRLAYSVHVRPRRRRISQVPDASVSGHAVLSDPAAVSGSHRL
jgi:hypothetical protein